MELTDVNNQKIYEQAEELIQDIEDNCYPDDVTYATKGIAGLQSCLAGWIEHNESYFRTHKAESTALTKILYEVKAKHEQLHIEQTEHKESDEWNEAMEKNEDAEFLTRDEAEFSHRVDWLSGDLARFLKNLKNTMGAIEKHEREADKSR